MIVSLDKLRERNFNTVVENVRKNKTAHVTTLMVSEDQMNRLKQMFICASVPYSGNGKCFLLCR